MSLLVRPLREEERGLVRALAAEAFNLSAEAPVLGVLDAAPLREFRVIAEHDRYQGSLRARPFAQFFGGRAVDVAGITYVQISAAGRSRGYGRVLMNEVLAELYADGVPLSALYPSTPSLYRRVGYELAGAYVRYQFPVTQVPRHRTPDLEPWGDDDLPEVAACYRRVAQASSGLIDRPEGWWAEKVLAPPPGRPVFRYCMRRNGAVRGYLVYTQDPEPADLPNYYSLRCRDLMWNDADAARALLSFIAGHRALGFNVSWVGPVEDPLAGFLDEREVAVKWAFPHWMLRLVDVTKALEARGYPKGLEASVELEVADPAIDANRRALRLHVAGGAGRVEPLLTARARIDVGMLSAIYTGWLPARDAVRAGRLLDASADEVATLEAVFSGPRPWLADLF
jgi:predicted acetyltransferase